METIKKYTQEEFNKLPRNIYGTKYCPPGDYTEINAFLYNCVFADRSIFGSNCRFGSWCHFGSYCTFKENCKFEDRCKFGIGCKFETGCNFGIGCVFAEWCEFADRCRFEHFCSFGDFCKFGIENMFGEECSFQTYCNFDKYCVLGENCIIGELCRFERPCVCEFGEFKKILTGGGFGSAGRTTYFFYLTDGRIFVRSGCFTGSIEEWKSKVKETHGTTPYAKSYLLLTQAVEEAVKCCT